MSVDNLVTQESGTFKPVRSGERCEAFKSVCDECGFAFRGEYEDETICPGCTAERKQCESFVCREAKAMGKQLCIAHWKMQEPELKRVIEIAKVQRVPFIISTIKQIGKNRTPDFSPEIIKLREMIDEAYEEMPRKLKAADYGYLVKILLQTAEVNKKLQEQDSKITEAVQRQVEQTRSRDAVYYMAYILLFVFEQFGSDSKEVAFVKSRLLHYDVALYKSIMKKLEELKEDLINIYEDSKDDPGYNVSDIESTIIEDEQR